MTELKGICTGLGLEVSGTKAELAERIVSARATKYTGGRDEAGRYDGMGCLTTPDGAKYTGQFQNGKKHGQGKSK